MKLQIDFDNKIIRVEESTTLQEFFDKCNRVVPSEEWKEYKLEVGITTWVSPVIINPYYPTIPQPPYYITCTGICNYEIE